MSKRTITPGPAAWLLTLNDMLDSREFDFSRDFLEDVRDQVEVNNRITTNQTKAILNIRRSIQ